MSPLRLPRWSKTSHAEKLFGDYLACKIFPEYHPGIITFWMVTSVRVTACISLLILYQWQRNHHGRYAEMSMVYVVVHGRISLTPMHFDTCMDACQMKLFTNYLLSLGLKLNHVYERYPRYKTVHFIKMPKIDSPQQFARLFDILASVVVGSSWSMLYHWHCCVVYNTVFIDKSWYKETEYCNMITY